MRMITMSIFKSFKLPNEGVMYRTYESISVSIRTHKKSGAISGIDVVAIWF